MIVLYSSNSTFHALHQDRGHMRMLRLQYNNSSDPIKVAIEFFLLDT